MKQLSKKNLFFGQLVASYFPLSPPAGLRYRTVGIFFFYPRVDL
jgi:hypothetical protein